MRILCGLVLVVFASAAAADAQLAWWVSVRFAATESRIEGIPLRDLDRTWAAASPLRERSLGREAFAPGESLKDHNAAFELIGDLNSDGTQDKALVGVYRTDRGMAGEFLLILTQDRGQDRWRKSALFKNEGQAGFSALEKSTSGKDSFSWVFCLECDGVCIVRPTGGKRALDCDTEPTV